ncbi:hypothetical protein HID58_093218 [Brassica napus]|uniref:F-box associated beta-propeller type 3 domain-containing protein n=1 Tax=Brassica napus TaxID=3708 RepID=A0ABQ7XC73_BRANA|nr:hypothetical protein HID58_093218 [Brassica napus]
MGVRALGLIATRRRRCIKSMEKYSKNSVPPHVPEDLALWSRLPILNEILEWDGRVAFLKHPNLENDGDDFENEGDVFENEGVMKVWVIENAEKNQWSSKTLVLPPSQMKIFNMPMVVNLSLKPQGTTRKGEVILVPQNIRYCRRTRNISIGPEEITHFYIFLYNIQKNHMRKVEITKSSSRYLTTKWDVIGLDDVENLMYLYA